MASKQVFKNAKGVNAEVTLVNPDTNFNKRTVELNSIMDKTPTIATLRAKTEIPETIYVTGYHSEGDGAFGSHFFRWNSESIEDDNGGTVIKLDGVETGRYELQYDGAVNVKWFGAVGNDISYASNNTIAIQNAINSQNDVFISDYFYIDNTLTLNYSSVIFGGNAMNDNKSNGLIWSTDVDEGIVVDSNQVSIKNLYLHGNNKVLKLITNIGHHWMKVQDNRMVGCKAGGTYIWGGGTLYMLIENNEISQGGLYPDVSPRGIDFIESNSTIGYYGTNWSVIKNNNFYFRNSAIRISGDVLITENDFEGRNLDDNGCIEIGDQSIGNIRIISNYFEMSPNTETSTISRLLYVLKAPGTLSFSTNTVFGPNTTDSRMIDDNSNYIQLFNMRDNKILRWDYCLYQTSFSSTGLYNASGNTYSDVNNVEHLTFSLSYPQNSNLATIVKEGDSDRSDTNKPNSYYQRNTYSQSYSYLQTTTTALRLDRGPLFQINNPTGTVITLDRTSIDVTDYIGMTIEIYFSTSVELTNDNNNFKCVKVGNPTVPAGRVLSFLVSPQGILTEIGDSTLNM